ncbi:MAG: tryptophan 7-halogenase [Colwellia sp.]|nr:tryptophan 7-halogenase [Colwellia sp.]
MKNNKINTIVIVGGGTAGWIMASSLSRTLRQSDVNIVLVESPDIATIGVGEATIPSFVDFLNFLGVPEKDFLTATKATFKLGIKFTDWNYEGHEYWHQFGGVGMTIDAKPFYQHWLKHKFNGGTSHYTDFSPAIAMAKAGKFYIQPDSSKSILSNSEYAYHFDAGEVVNFLTEYSIERGVKHVRDKVVDVKKSDDGSIDSVLLENTGLLEGDFFIDCTGQRALLIGDAMRVGYEDWSQYLPVDRAVTVLSELPANIPPYTHSIARSHGWQWCIPLQDRVGNGYVYSSAELDDSDAESFLMSNLIGAAINKPRTLRFKTGKRKKFWDKNCLSIGLSSGFLEPLESTSIHLILKGTLNFLQMYPSRSISEATIKEYNRLMDIEYQCIRDFIIIHYSLSDRKDTRFWRKMTEMALPPSLQSKLELFLSQGRLQRNDLDLFSSTSWYAVLEGMEVHPQEYDPLIDLSDFSKVKEVFTSYSQSVIALIEKLPTHAEYIQKVKNIN